MLPFENRTTLASVGPHRLRLGLLAEFPASPEDTHTAKPPGMQPADLGRKEG